MSNLKNAGGCSNPRENSADGDEQGCVEKAIGGIQD